MHQRQAPTKNTNTERQAQPAGGAYSLPGAGKKPLTRDVGHIDKKGRATIVIIKTLRDVPLGKATGYEGVSKMIVLGPDDGSTEIVLRHFSLASKAASPHHAHGFPHLVKVEAGNGVVTDGKKMEHRLQEGDYVFIGDNEMHQFKNTGTEPFEFICMVPGRGET